MKNGKETKVTETPSKDPSFEMFNRDEFFNNVLSLPENVKTKLNAEGKDWRFIDGNQFRSNGGVHRSHWKPEVFKEPEFKHLTNAEGHIQRKEMILAVRPKHITGKYKDYLSDRNNRLKGYNKAAAKELARSARKAGVAEDGLSVSEGYEDND